MAKSLPKLSPELQAIADEMIEHAVKRYENAMLTALVPDETERAAVRKRLREIEGVSKSGDDTDPDGDDGEGEGAPEGDGDEPDGGDDDGVADDDGDEDEGGASDSRDDDDFEVRADIVKSDDELRVGLTSQTATDGYRESVSFKKV